MLHFLALFGARAVGINNTSTCRLNYVRFRVAKDLGCYIELALEVNLLGYEM